MPDDATNLTRGGSPIEKINPKVLPYGSKLKPLPKGLPPQFQQASTLEATGQIPATPTHQVPPIPQTTQQGMGTIPGVTLPTYPNLIPQPQYQPQSFAPQQGTSPLANYGRFNPGYRKLVNPFVYY